MFEKCKDLFYTIFLTMILAVCGQTEIFGYISSDVSHVDFLLVYVYTLCGLFYNFSQWVFSKCCFCSCFGDLSYSYHCIAFNFPHLFCYRYFNVPFVSWIYIYNKLSFTFVFCRSLLLNIFFTPSFEYWKKLVLHLK